MPTPIAIAVVEREGRFLAGQRPEGVPLAGMWEFPGGKILPGESAEEAAVRECLEETGLVVTPSFRYSEQLESYEHGTVQLAFIACRLVEAEQGEPRAPFRWVPRGDLPRLEFPSGNRQLISQLAGMGSVVR
jgi:8-oxo-dGTP diphosphatase